jgi:hypothetical protein
MVPRIADSGEGGREVRQQGPRGSEGQGQVRETDRDQPHRLPLATHSGDQRPLSAKPIGAALLYEPVGVYDYVIYCADRWYHSGVFRYGPDSVEVARERDAFNHEVFRFNISKSIGLALVIEVIGDSREVLRGLRDGFFDVIYVDGYHGSDQ